jgi:hypothetical protein
MDGPPHWVLPARCIVGLLSNEAGANYCYLNSVVHMLAHCEGLRRCIYKAFEECKEISRSGQSDAKATSCMPCPMQTLVETFAEYYITEGTVAQLRPLRTLMHTLNESYRAGRKNDASEALESILCVVDADMALHSRASLCDTDRAYDRRPRCVARCADGARTAGSSVITAGLVANPLPPLAALLAFSRCQTWRCGTGTCPNVGQFTRRELHYVRRVHVFPLLFKENVSGETELLEAPDPSLTFGEVVRARQREEDEVFSCPGCGERPRTQVNTVWTTPTSCGTIQLAWHQQPPTREAVQYFLTRVVSDTTCLRDFVSWHASDGGRGDRRRSAQLTSLVLLKRDHYVALVRDHKTGAWRLANDAKPVVDAGSSWPEASRHIWKNRWIPVLLSYSNIDDVVHGDAKEHIRRASVRPTVEFLNAKATNRPSVGEVDQNQRTLTDWVTTRAPKCSPPNDTANASAPRPELPKRQREDDIIDVESTTDVLCVPRTTTTLPSTAESDAQRTLHECFPTISKRVMTQVLGRHGGSVDQAADELSQSKGWMLRHSIGEEESRSRSIAPSVRTTLERARAPVSAAFPLALRPRTFCSATSPVLGKPLQGKTLIVIAGKKTREELEHQIEKNGGTIGSLRDSMRVLDSYLIVDFGYVCYLAGIGKLHTTTEAVAKMETYQSSLYRTDIVDAVEKRIASSHMLFNSTEYRIPFTDIQALMEQSTNCVLDLLSPTVSRPKRGRGPPVAFKVKEPERKRGHCVLPEALRNGPLTRNRARELQRSEAMNVDASEDKTFDDLIFHTIS